MRADRGGESFTVCLVDIDELRKINAQSGFKAGDKLLAATTDGLRRELCRASKEGGPNFIARYDGDAIAVSLRHARPRAAADAIEKVRRKLTGSSTADGAYPSLSAAVVAYEPGEGLDNLLHRLERTLHLGKQFGLGRIELASPTGWERASKLRAAVG